MTQAPADILEKAEAWVQAQLAKAEKAHGAAWPDNRQWVEDYVREEVRMRLAERGWSAS